MDCWEESEGRFCNMDFMNRALALPEASVAFCFLLFAPDAVLTPDADARRPWVRQVLQPMCCTPIFVPMDIFRGSYLGYCKQILWPAFHNVRLERAGMILMI